MRSVCCWATWEPSRSQAIPAAGLGEQSWTVCTGSACGRVFCWWTASFHRNRQRPHSASSARLRRAAGPQAVGVTHCLDPRDRPYSISAIWCPMMDEIRSNNNVVYRCTLPRRLVPEVPPPGHRRRHGRAPKADHPGGLRRTRRARSRNCETMPDHVHLLVACDPQYGIHRLVKQIKGRSSRLLRPGVPPPQDPGCPPCGPTRTSSRPSAAQPWRSSSAMSRTSATPRAHPYLPMAEARGFSGAFR